MTKEELTGPPTSEEIAKHRRVMKFTDQVIRRPEGEYTDEQIIKYLTEPMSDSGNTLLGMGRVGAFMIREYKKRHAKLR